jgi:beta-lactamase class D
VPDPADTAATIEFRTGADFAHIFGGIDGTFVLLDGRTGRRTIYNAERAARGYVPASTFKIPNALIALETGVADGPGFTLSRDTTRAPRADWWPAAWLGDHTLTSALPASVVWYFQELARRIGSERMQAWLDDFEYGNADISGGIDRFWLSGGLRISAEQQVDFLSRLHRGELGVSDDSRSAVLEAIVLEKTRAYRFSGKTGWAGLGVDVEPDIGWLVGFLERGDDVYIYATNIDIRTNADARNALESPEIYWPNSAFLAMPPAEPQCMLLYWSILQTSVRHRGS